MSEEQTQEQDAAMIAEAIRRRADYWDMGSWGNAVDMFDAACRVNARLTAERDALAAAYEAAYRAQIWAKARQLEVVAELNRLIDAFRSVPEEFERMHLRINRDGQYPNGSVYSMLAEKTADAIYAALERMGRND